MCWLCWWKDESVVAGVLELLEPRSVVCECWREWGGDELLTGIDEGKRGKWGLVLENDPDPEAPIEGPVAVTPDRRCSGDRGGDGDLDFELGLGRVNESGRPDLVVVEGGVVTGAAPD